MSLVNIERSRVQLLCVVVVGTVVTTMGEAELALGPFLIQGTAVLVVVGVVTLKCVALTDAKKTGGPHELRDAADALLFLFVVSRDIFD